MAAKKSQKKISGWTTTAAAAANSISAYIVRQLYQYGLSGDEFRFNPALPHSGQAIDLNRAETRFQI
jgi:hypothetical protein